MSRPPAYAFGSGNPNASLASPNRPGQMQQPPSLHHKPNSGFSRGPAPPNKPGQPPSARSSPSPLQQQHNVNGGPSMGSKNPFANYQQQTNLGTPNSATSQTSLLPKGGKPYPAANTPSSASLSVPAMRSASQFSDRSTSPSLSVSGQYDITHDFSIWGKDNNVPESDDYLHNPDPRRDRKNDGGTIFTLRGLMNLGCVAIMVLGLVTLFAGYPIITYFSKNPIGNLGASNLGGTNATGQVATMSGNWALVDKDTPDDVRTKTSYTNGEEWELVFSDEFNLDGRTFYPGDDPYWEAVDLHYWGTNNLEWYDPEAVSTKDGHLVISLSNEKTHGLNYKGGMIQSWNKFCFTGGLLEVSAVLPGSSSVWGLWPAVWSMGNLGRAGFGASLDGMWPYSYDVCDVGTLPNQTYPDGTPEAAATGGYEGSALSFLPGQRLSACTCEGEIHPGPKHTDGTWIGRSAPEIDVFEAQVSEATAIGHVSQSAQWGPFNAEYKWKNATDSYTIWNPKFKINSYRGANYQQTTSAIGDTDQACYELTGGCASIYGFEYEAGNDGFITWISEGEKSWTVRSPALVADDIVEIGARPVPVEPMYIIINLGLSENFGDVDYENLIFPTHLLVDWVRVYQPKNSINIGCDPEDFPTHDYIQTYIETYTNPNMTTWEQAGQTFPKNRLVDTC